MSSAFSDGFSEPVSLERKAEWGLSGCGTSPWKVKPESGSALVQAGGRVDG